MSQETTGRSNAVTKVGDRKKERGGQALMSFTAVSSHPAMAKTFVKELIRLGNQIMPDRELTVEDLIAICHTSLNDRNEGVVMLEGRHLRQRIGEQVARSKRYDETFSLFVIGLNSERGSNEYDAVVDTLCERLRNTDLMFPFKHRLVLILPHTEVKSCEILTHRVQELLGPTQDLELQISHSTYPSDDFAKGSHVMDWVEDQIRS